MVGRYPARSELKVVHGVMVLGMRHEGLDSEYTVTSSSSYSSSSEVKARNSEVRRVPGNGFSSCAAPTFSHVQGISNRGQNRFPDCVGTEICTGTIPNTRVSMRGTEVWSSCGLEVRRICGIELSLAEESSRMRQI